MQRSCGWLCSQRVHQVQMTEMGRVWLETSGYKAKRSLGTNHAKTLIDLNWFFSYWTAMRGFLSSITASPESEWEEETLLPHPDAVDQNLHFSLVPRHCAHTQGSLRLWPGRTVSRRGVCVSNTVRGSWERTLLHEDWRDRWTHQLPQ